MTTMPDLPIACSLDGPALGRRQAELRASVLAEAESVERLTDGYRWRFRHAPGLFARLGPIIDGERHCCRFLRFTVTADQDHGSVTVEITAVGTADFLESWTDVRPA